MFDIERPQSLVVAAQFVPDRRRKLLQQFVRDRRGLALRNPLEVGNPHFEGFSLGAPVRHALGKDRIACGHLARLDERQQVADRSLTAGVLLLQALQFGLLQLSLFITGVKDVGQKCSQPEWFKNALLQLRQHDFIQCFLPDGGASATAAAPIHPGITLVISIRTGLAGGDHQGANEWAFAADRTDVLSKADLAGLRQLIAEIFNDELANAGLAADFTHLSRLARGLAPSDERHRGPKKYTKQADTDPGLVAEIQPMPPEPEFKSDQAPESEPSSGSQNADPAGPPVGGVDETVPQADTVSQAEPLEPTRIMLPVEDGGRDVLPPVAEPSGLVSSPPSTDAEQPNDRPASIALEAIKIAGLEVTALGRAMAESVWQRTPWHRVSQAQQAEEDNRRAEDARREEERRRTEAERLAAEQAASRNAWWRTEMHEIIKRNHLLHMHDAADLSNARIYDNADDRKFIHQTLQNPDLSEAERGAFLKAFELAKQDYYEPGKRAQAQRDLAAYAKSDRQRDAEEAAISTRRAELNRSTGRSATRAGSDTAINDRGDGFVTRPGGQP